MFRIGVADLRILARFLIAFQDMIDGPIERGQPGGITGDDLGQHPAGGADLLLADLVGYQTGEDLLSDVFAQPGLKAPFARWLWSARRPCWKAF